MCVPSPSLLGASNQVGTLTMNKMRAQSEGRAKRLRAAALHCHAFFLLYLTPDHRTTALPRPTRLAPEPPAYSLVSCLSVGRGVRGSFGTLKVVHPPSALIPRQALDLRRCGKAGSPLRVLTVAQPIARELWQR